MGARNPYLQGADPSLPAKPFKVTFLPMNVTVEVDPDDLPYNDDVRPGSLLDIALHAGIDLDHACGGFCACSTCHVVVVEGVEALSEAGEDEEDMLDNAAGLKPTSRLACQAVPNGTADIVCEIPQWNRNLAKE